MSQLSKFSASDPLMKIWISEIVNAPSITVNGRKSFKSPAGAVFSQVQVQVRYVFLLHPPPPLGFSAHLLFCHQGNLHKQAEGRYVLQDHSASIAVYFDHAGNPDSISLSPLAGTSSSVLALILGRVEEACETTEAIFGEGSSPPTVERFIRATKITFPANTRTEEETLTRQWALEVEDLAHNVYPQIKQDLNSI